MSALRPPASTWFPMFGLFMGSRTSNDRPKPAAKMTGAGTAAPQVDFERILAGFRAPPAAVPAPAPEVAVESIPPAPRPAANEDVFDAAALEGRQRKLRDRYIAVRFRGIARSGADLADEEQLIRVARLMFEDERGDDAIELLELAIEEFPDRQGPWLARLEILYLVRDAAGFSDAARAFAKRFGTDGETWNEICRLGCALVPGEPLFAGDVAVRDHEHYGPWPHTPNWIRSSWDLTADVAAADFHHTLRRAREAALKEAA